MNFIQSTDVNLENMYYLEYRGKERERKMGRERSPTCGSLLKTHTAQQKGVGQNPGTPSKLHAGIHLVG